MTEFTTDKQAVEKYLKQVVLLLSDAEYGKINKLNPPNNTTTGTLGTVLTNLCECINHLLGKPAQDIFSKSLLESIPDPLIVTDDEGTIFYVGKGVERLFGYSTHELINCPFDMLVADLENMNKIEKLEADLYEHGLVPDFSASFRSKDGMVIPVLCSCSLLTSSIGQITGKLYLVKDVRQLQATLDDLNTKNKELSTFIYKATHDLKGPVSSIRGLLEIAKADIEDAEALKIYIGLMDDSITRLDNFILELLELGRITQQQLVFTPIHFGDVVNEILQSLIHMPGREKVNITIDDKQERAFLTERRMITSILQNLIENAIKYQKPQNPHQEVRVSIFDMADGICIEISDNGLGIPEEAQPYIFDMFYRATSSAKGSGLGLYLVKSSLEKLKGHISLHSVENEGSTFILFIPRARSGTHNMAA